MNRVFVGDSDLLRQRMRRTPSVSFYRSSHGGRLQGGGAVVVVCQLDGVDCVGTFL